MKIRYILKNKNTNQIHIKKYEIEAIEKGGLKELFDIDNYEIIARNLFTGLTDKNGKEIYEGDIDNKGRVCEYFHQLGSFGFKNPKYSAITFLGQFITSSGEIIGNIFENP